jgi:hypothetical protein
VLLSFHRQEDDAIALVFTLIVSFSQASRDVDCLYDTRKKQRIYICATLKTYAFTVDFRTVQKPRYVCHEQFSSCYSLLRQEERCSCLYHHVRCLFEFVLLQVYRILDVHLVFLFVCKTSSLIEQNRMNNISLVNQS